MDFPIWDLPTELIIIVLRQMIENPVTASISSSPSTIYVCPEIKTNEEYTDCDGYDIITTHLLPSAHQSIRNLLHAHLWEETIKKFDRMDTFFDFCIRVVGHRSNMNNLLSTITPWLSVAPLMPFALCSPRGLTGLEFVHLHLNATEYFHLFDVVVPPYDTRQLTMFWPFWAVPEGTGRLLIPGTKHLTLEFDLYDGGAWYESTDWIEEHEEDWEKAGSRMACDKGLVVDWILSFAWARGYIKHLESLTLVGDVQPWVAEKWTEILERWRTRDSENPPFEHNPNLRAICEIGLQEALVQGQEWKPWEHYPPRCTCETPCDKKEWDEEGWKASGCKPWN